MANLYLSAALVLSSLDLPPNDSTVFLDRVHMSLKSYMRTVINLYRQLSILLIDVVGVLPYIIAVLSYFLTNIQPLESQEPPLAHF